MNTGFRVSGFTFVELVAIILIVGILAVAAVPRFFSTSGFAESTYQARLISALRTMQERAMQDTRNSSSGTNFCYQIGILRDADSAFGPATMNFVDLGNQALSCTTMIQDDTDLEYMTATNSDMLNDAVRISAGPDVIQFSSLGCPIVASVACGSSVQVDITGENTVSVCVESQGYIHAGACE